MGVCQMGVCLDHTPLVAPGGEVYVRRLEWPSICRLWVRMRHQCVGTLPLGLHSNCSVGLGAAQQQASSAQLPTAERCLSLYTAALRRSG
jgi:hypothetical protein